MVSRFRASRRAGPMSAFALVLALAAGTASSSAADDWLPAERTPAADLPDAAAFGEVAPDASTLPEPTQTELTQSETAFTGLSDAAALDLAREEFANVLDAELIPELDLDPGQEVDKYLSPYAARITNGSDEPYQAGDGPNPNLLVEGSLPLRAPEAGDLRPLDSDLEQVGDHFEADNPIVNSEISADLEEGVELPAADFTVAPEGTEAAAAEPVADKVFYPNATTDSDYLIAPMATGVEIFIQLRSAESPESFPLDLDLPDGGTLEATPDGGAVVKVGGDTVVTVEPPRTLDAADKEIPTHYAISGDQLTVEVDHRNQEFLYPIMVDPVFDQYNWGAQTAGNPNPGPEGWLWADDGYNDFSGFYHNNEGGLMTRAHGTAQQPRDYLANQWGEWYLPAIGNSSIERVDFFEVDHSPSHPGACTQIGIWNPGSWWAGPSLVSNPGPPAQYWGVNDVYQFPCGVVSHATRTFNVGFNTEYDGPGGDPEAAPGSMAIFALKNSYTGTRNQGVAENLVRATHIYRLDKYGPTGLNMVYPSPGTAWTDQYWFNAQDAGLGLAGVWIWGPNWTIPGTGSMNCSGAHQNPCPSNGYVIVNNLPEGRHDYTAMAVDPVLNGSAGLGFTARIDRRGPDISLGGPLKATENQQLSSGSYALTLQMSDGQTTTPDTERSGVTEYWVYVDGQEKAHEAPGCPTHSCSLNRSWSYNTAAFTDSPHVVAVVAKDAAGNYSTDCFGVDRSTPQEQETTFHLISPSPLSQVTPAITGSGQTLVRLLHEGASTGGQEFYPGSVVDQLNDYSLSYATLHGVAPTIREITFAGRVGIGSLGSLGQQVDTRTIECADDSDADTDETESGLGLPDLGPDDPDYERTTYPTEQFAPYKGKVLTSTLVRADGSTRRYIKHNFRFTAAALEEFDVSGLDHAYEHDMDLFHQPGVAKCDENSDFNQAAYWAERDNAFLYDTNIPEEVHPRLDIVFDDDCDFGQQDFTLWLEHPGELEPGKVYTVTFLAKKGLQNSGRYKLNAWSLDRDCNIPDAGTDIDMGCTDPPVFGSGALQQLLVGKDRGSAPEVRCWRKGESSRLCEP